MARGRRPRKLTAWSPEPESLVLQLLRDMRTEIGDMRAEMAIKTDIADLRSKMGSLRAGVAADIIDLRKDIDGVRKDLGEQIVGLRRAVVGYHICVVRHGIIISDLDACLRRVKQHLNLPGADPH